MQHAHKSAFGQASAEGGRWRMSDILVLSVCGCHFVCGIKRFREIPLFLSLYALGGAHIKQGFAIKAN